MGYNVFSCKDPKMRIMLMFVNALLDTKHARKTNAKLFLAFYFSYEKKQQYYWVMVLVDCLKIGLNSITPQNKKKSLST